MKLLKIISKDRYVSLVNVDDIYWVSLDCAIEVRRADGSEVRECAIYIYLKSDKDPIEIRYTENKSKVYEDFKKIEDFLVQKESKNTILTFIDRRK